MTERVRKSLLLVNLPGETHRAAAEHCGLAFLKAFVGKTGVDVEILDAYALQGDDAYCAAEFDRWLRRHAGDERFVGISPFVSGHKHLVTFGRHVKTRDPGCVIFVGGHYATLNRERLLRELEWLDAVVVGEGELSVAAFVKDGLSKPLPGVYARGHETSFSPRARISCLDDLPWQDRYLTPAQLGDQPLSITTSRGCYGACSFCSISTFYRTNTPCVKQTFRSAKSVADELRNLVERFGVRTFKIVDDNFFRGGDESFLEDLTRRVEGMGLSFRLSARPNDITLKRALLLRRMGVVVVALGVESANPASLELFRKGIDEATSERAIATLRDNNIACLANFIMFDPVIDLRGLERNCEFVARHAGECIFHRVNSHLWIRPTDPVAEELVAKGLCRRRGFPYLECEYRHASVARVKRRFDDYCARDMACYYRSADVVMSNGVRGHEDDFERVKRILRADLAKLTNLVAEACGEEGDI